MENLRAGGAGVVVGAVFASVLIGTVPMALASLGDVVTSRSTFSSDRLLAPTSLTTSTGCSGTGLTVPTVTLSWTPSATTWATGQEVRQSLAAAGIFTVVASQSAAANTVTLSGLLPATTYWFDVRTVKNNWRAATPAVSVTTRNCPL